jgi:RNA polymerase sigma-70 factor (ECF subfamily)
MASLSPLTEGGVQVPGAAAPCAAPPGCIPAGGRPQDASIESAPTAAAHVGNVQLSPAQQRLAEVIARHQQAVAAYLRSRVLRAEEADDLVQEVFLRLYMAGDRFDASRTIEPYLLGIARNVLREWARRQRTRREVSWTDVCLEAEAAPSELSSQYEEELQHLPACLQQLPAPARQAVEMHYRHKACLQEIGQALRRSVGAVKLLLYRARQALRRCLDRKRGEPSHD